jgi:hypothetical protein
VQVIVFGSECVHYFVVILNQYISNAVPNVCASHSIGINVHNVVPSCSVSVYSKHKEKKPMCCYSHTHSSR